MLEVAYISYNTGTCALPDIYALALGRCAPSGIVHIYQATHSCLCYNLYLLPSEAMLQTVLQCDISDTTNHRTDK